MEDILIDINNILDDCYELSELKNNDKKSREDILDKVLDGGLKYINYDLAEEDIEDIYDGIYILEDMLEDRFNHIRNEFQKIKRIKK